MGKTPTRDVSPFLQFIRTKLIGRDNLRPHLRFPEDLSPRTMPLPNLPEGPAHKLNDNYYYARDARRLVTGPLAITGPDEIKRISSAKPEETSITVKLRTPGNNYYFGEHKF